MSWASPSGKGITTPRDETKSVDVKKKAKAVAMAGLLNQGWSLRAIAVFFGTNHKQVKRIISRLPLEARKLRGQGYNLGPLASPRSPG